jgi:hypothetical protein
MYNVLRRLIVLPRLYIELYIKYTYYLRTVYDVYAVAYTL